MSTPMALDDGIDEMEAWKMAADQAIAPFLLSGEVFSADDVHDFIAKNHPDMHANLTSGQRSAWPGSYFRQLADAGVIVKADWGASTRASRRHGSRHEWRAAS